VIDEPGEAPAAPDVPRAAVRIASAELFRGRREVVIVHRDQEYRLHITKAGKLILTK
jgi:hemin uptake protein HemP